MCVFIWLDAYVARRVTLFERKGFPLGPIRSDLIPPTRTPAPAPVALVRKLLCKMHKVCDGFLFVLRLQTESYASQALNGSVCV